MRAFLHRFVEIVGRCGTVHWGRRLGGCKKNFVYFVCGNGLEKGL
jgi:hypothetical protein